MAKKKPAPIRDEVGDQWQAKADAAWALALEQADGDTNAALSTYLRRRRDADDEPETAQPPLPPFDEEKHPSVRREAFGRFLEDRDTGVVHDVYHPLKGCAVDRITKGTFYHFGHEVPDDLVRHDCIQT